ncbi:MAG: hypothetical protein M1834_002559 [Cirrosporium novae-zelandiae]|nr:MAG: hypothetical protein M1834_002559 [Cirrosporium novae-zelandiae]
MSTTTPTCSLSIHNINPHVKAAKYAVRGELATRAEEYRVRLTQSSEKRPPTPPDEKSPLPFKDVIFANIGNPQQLDQKPITFFRQVLSLLENPHLLENSEALTSIFNYPPDVISRAQKLLAEVHSIGAYSVSQGVPFIRQTVANFLKERDGYPSAPHDIYLTAGASSGVNTLMNVICASSSTGVLVPIPQYPLYTATLSVLNARCVPYYLDESNSWSTSISDIKSSLAEAKKSGTDVRAMVIINPGNPTGASLSPEDMKSAFDIAAEERLVVMADEVYQTNVFAPAKWTSFKKVLRDLQSDSSNSGKFDNIELVSFHSTSKGMVGECGHRGGYFELVGFDPEVAAQINKFVSIQLCPPVVAQCLVDLMVNPPRNGSQSYDLYKKEYDTIYYGLESRAKALHKVFTSLPNIECQDPQGAMYLFPTIRIPPKACEAATKEGRKPDEFYCLRMLEGTGICTVPGSGFGQKDGTWHFRTTFLPGGTEWVERISKFHRKFMEEYK